MKTFIAIIALISLPVFCRADNSSPSPLIGTQADFTTKDGTKWSGKIIGVTLEDITISTKNGGGNVSYASMSAEDAKKYGFDANKERAALKQELENAKPMQTQRAVNQAEWHEVAVINGSADKNSEPFVISSDRWRVKWSSSTTALAKEMTSKAGFGNGDATTFFGAEAVSENDKTNKQNIVGAKIGPGSDVTELKGVGPWHIEVISANLNWNLVVEELR